MERRKATALSGKAVLLCRRSIQDQFPCPPLKYQVIKGVRDAIAEGTIDSSSIRDGVVTVSLSRWSSLSQKGWYSGDIHIHHIAPKTCHLEMDAEDLNVANILTSDFTLDQEQFEGRVNSNSSGNHLIYVNQEFRNDELGHLCLLNLKKLVEPVKKMQHHHHPLHLHVYDEVHGQGGYVSWLISQAGLPWSVHWMSPWRSWMGEILCALEPRDMPIFMKRVVLTFRATMACGSGTAI
jgi:hypothetical protein